MVRAQIAPNAVIQKNPDFIMLAQAYGCHTAQPTTLDDFKTAVQDALSADGPTVIHVTADIS
jgi:acetolactate synthase-1/2/3 large subunit/5-guanidino-2-oxopentanoate decarboxylase